MSTKNENTTKESVNIYLHSPEVKDGVLSGSSSYERYIILMNDSLQLENKKNSSMITELETKVEELEDELGTSEVRNNNIKGLLKNFHEMNKWHSELDLQKSSILSKIQINMTQYKQKATKHVRIFEAALLVVLGLVYENYNIYDFVSMFLLLSIVVSFQESLLLNLQVPVCTDENKRINELKEDILKTTKAQDYIHEFIDQL
jgi:hypothetical protein